MTLLDSAIWLAAGWFVPLGLRLCGARADLVYLLSPAALLASFWPPAACAWLGATLYVLLIGLGRWRRRTLPELCQTFGMLYLPVGGAWWLAWKWGWQPLGFSGLIVGLTGVHFHYAGFAAPVLTGLLGRFRRPPSYLPAALVVMVGPALVALGITGSRSIEAFSAWLLGCALAWLGWLAWPLSRWHKASAVCIWLSMALAALYATGRLTGHEIVALETMIPTHGLLNVGFVTCAFRGYSGLGGKPIEASSSG